MCEILIRTICKMLDSEDKRWTDSNIVDKLRDLKGPNIITIINRDAVKISEHVCGHPVNNRSYVGKNMLMCNDCGKIFQ